MDFPLDRPRRIGRADGLAEALGATPQETWAGQFVVAVLGSEAEVRGLKPDLAALARVAGAGWGPGHVIAAAIADPTSPYDVVSRFFAPGSGVPEDPTTGAAHCTLSPLFSDKLGLTRLRFHQAYPGRGGDLEAETRDDRALLSGRAVTVLESRLRPV
jgi:predicted PhzF superfamily epimerase YddE/YHI9